MPAEGRPHHATLAGRGDFDGGVRPAADRTGKEKRDRVHDRNAGIRVIRDNIVIHDGKLISLKRFKDDVKEVDKGYECGLQIENYNDIQEGDQLLFYMWRQTLRCFLHHL